MYINTLAKLLSGSSSLKIFIWRGKRILFKDDGNDLYSSFPFVNYSFVHSRSFRGRWNFDERELTCRLGKLKGRGKCGKKKKKGVAVWRYR